MRQVSKFCINFGEILLPAHGNLEEQSKVLEPSIIIINLLLFLLLMHVVIR